MKKQLLVVETVPGKTLGFQSLSKMFCIVAIAAAVALSPESTGPLAPSAAQAQTSGDCGCTLRWIDPRDYDESDFCGYQLSKELAVVDYGYCLELCDIEREYRDKMAFLDWLEEEVADWLDDDELRAQIDAARENVEEKRSNRMYAAYRVVGEAYGSAYQRREECEDRQG